MKSFKLFFSYGSAVVNHLIAGGKVVSEIIYEARAAICRECPSNKNNICQECGCNLEGDSAFVSKLLMPTEHCPLNKWCSYSEIGSPIPKINPKLYKINMMLKADGSSIYNNTSNQLNIEMNPLDNSQYGVFLIKDSESNISSDKSNNGGCNCNTNK